MDKKRILIIDDEASFTRMVRLNLEKTGKFEVREENRAGHAVAVARDFHPDLILLDVIMPTMDGGDLAATFRKDRHLKNVPIIFLTATVSQREAGSGGLSSGGSLFLAKPVSVDILIARIEEHLPPADKPEADNVKTATESASDASSHKVPEPKPQPKERSSSGPTAKS
jgi:DNA-binding response OmpR family regulator